MCCLQNEPVTYSPLLTKHCPRCSKIENYTNTHTTHLYVTDNFLCSFYLFSQSQQSLTKCIFLFVLKGQNCHLVSLIVLFLQWMLKWSKRVSLRSVSSTNYPTLHHPLLSTFLFFSFLFFYMFTNLTHHQILQYTRRQKQIHTTFTHVLAYKTQKWSKTH